MPEFESKPLPNEAGPDTREKTSADESLDWIEQRRDRLNVATQETRFSILEHIIAHPSQLPSLKELDYFMMEVKESTIRNHLETLMKAGLVEKVELPEEEQSRDLPSVFYGLTEVGREEMEELGLTEAEDILQEGIQRTKMPDDVADYMQAPRPEWEPANSLDDSSA